MPWKRILFFSLSLWSAIVKVLFYTTQDQLPAFIISKLWTVQWQCIIACNAIDKIIGIPICTMSLLTGISFILLLSAILTESSFSAKKMCTYRTSWNYADKLHTFSWHIMNITKRVTNRIYADLLLVQCLIIFVSFQKVKQNFSP